jgi:hypothetical protein
MDRAEFWLLIEACRDQAGGDQAAQTAAVYDRLERLSAEEVVSFDTHFRACMRAARRTDLLAAATIIDGFWVSTDAFQDFRSWLVSRGRAVYEASLADPDSLAETLEPGDDIEFEEFCYIAGRVWAEKTGRNRQEMSGPSGPPSQSSGPDGPNFANEEELRRRFPRLWAKFPQPEL